MESIERLKGGVVAFDTNCLIYYIEKHPEYSSVVRTFFQAIEKGEMIGITTTVTLTEVLTLPLQLKKEDLVNFYYEILTNSEYIELLEIDAAISKQAAILRAEYDKLRTPDAFQISAGILRSANAFICNDARLKKIKEIPVLILKDFL